MGLRLFVPLPMPRALYEEDFGTAESRDEFAGLLQQADRWFELPVRRGVDEEQLREHTEQRDPQYQQVGMYIADHCHILIALWDGAAMNGNGGTGQVVQVQAGRGAGRQVMAQHPQPAQPAGDRTVYQMSLPVSATQDRARAPSVRKRFPEREDHEEPRDRLRPHLRADRGPPGFPRAGLSAWKTSKQSKGYLLPGLDTETLPTPFRALCGLLCGRGRWPGTSSD